MAWLKAYARENQEHEDLIRVCLSQEQARGMIEQICGAHGYKPPLICFPTDGRQSFYQPRTLRKAECISILPGMMNVLTVIHEVGHLLHNHDYRYRRMKAVGTYQVRRFPREKAHGPVFRATVNRLAAEFRATRTAPVAQLDRASAF